MIDWHALHQEVATYLADRYGGSGCARSADEVCAITERALATARQTDAERIAGREADYIKVWQDWQRTVKENNGLRDQWRMASNLATTLEAEARTLNDMVDGLEDVVAEKEKALAQAEAQRDAARGEADAKNDALRSVWHVLGANHPLGKLAKDALFAQATPDSPGRVAAERRVTASLDGNAVVLRQSSPDGGKGAIACWSWGEVVEALRLLTPGGQENAR